MAPYPDGEWESRGGRLDEEMVVERGSSEGQKGNQVIRNQGRVPADARKPRISYLLSLLDYWTAASKWTLSVIFCLRIITTCLMNGWTGTGKCAICEMTDGLVAIRPF